MDGRRSTLAVGDVTDGRFAWDPAHYLKFDGPRRRAALDLLAAVDVVSPSLIHDLGCGNGDIARLMADRWPDAVVVGSDASVEMLGEARRTPSRVRWEQIDIADWDPHESYDLIYSNAVLHWLPDHSRLLPRLVDALAPGGVLAVQMPLSWHEPTARLMRDALAGSGGRPLGPDQLRARLANPPVADPDWYHGLLSPLVDTLHLWVTRYLHVLEGDDAVLEWVKGTALRPVLAGLSHQESELFMSRYGPALREAYPRRADGTTLLWFPRLFLVAGR